jgi:hypothetical protein
MHPFGFLFTAKSVIVKFWLPVVTLFIHADSSVQVIYGLGACTQVFFGGGGGRLAVFCTKAIYGH